MRAIPSRETTTTSDEDEDDDDNDDDDDDDDDDDSAPFEGYREDDRVQYFNKSKGKWEAAIIMKRHLDASWNISFTVLREGLFAEKTVAACLRPIVDEDESGHSDESHDENDDSDSSDEVLTFKI